MAKNTFAETAPRDDFSVRQERAVLVGVVLADRHKRSSDSPAPGNGLRLPRPTDAEHGPVEDAAPASVSHPAPIRWNDDPLAELAELVQSAGGVVAGRAIQRRQRIDPATYIGSGKAEEIRQKADALDADVVIFDNDLSPSQIRDLEKIIQRKVLDRSELILDIFASRARTVEARLQVELAQLEYSAPRLRGMWTHLERIAGAAGGTGVGAVGGLGTRGPGEKQIEIDRRLVEKRIAFLRDKLREIDRRKVREVKARKQFFTVSLVGYTNAGKSTLMNALTGAHAPARDRLFETLDTLTRKWDLGGGRHVLLSDTVGFIRDLPHHLVASFRATLEEAIHADLLLHVVDASNPEAQQQIDAVHDVLQALGADQRPTLLLLNKVDRIDEYDTATLAILRRRHPDALPISARSGVGLDHLADLVESRLRGEQRRMTLSIPARDGRALNFVERFAEVIDQRYEDGRAIVDLDISPRVLDQLHAIAADVRHVGGSDDER